MASVYCQELIRNSKTLCEGYIGEIIGRKKEPKIEVNDEKAKDDESIKSKDWEEKDKESKKSEKDDLGN